ncbi:hypothetical protein EV426DRAFT_345290 [Tirmania nivea]|nr:hypothetical protein EV426DRAFT_345290 [Tirmania nivea]
MSDTEAMINVVPPQTPPDPDAATIVHDFLEYTEHLHNDVARSLRLIGTLDNDYHRSTASLETLCVKYGEAHKSLPQQMAEVNGTGDWPYSVSQQDLGALTLRLSMARKLNEAIRAREEASAESVRLYDNVDRHFNKLSSTLLKLQQIPLPDREPTPPPAPPPEADVQPRITLRVADRFGSRSAFANLPVRRRKGATYGMGRAGRRPAIRREDDWEDLGNGERPVKRRGRRPGIGFQPKPLPPPPLTENGEPVDPLSLPWNRLMPHELARLRKRMKKNTQWTPSSTMILRELESLGRGIANKDKFLHQIESGDYPHCTPEDGGIGSLATESNLMTTENRGMKLNAAKRRLKEAQALAAGKTLPGLEDHDTKMEDSVVVGPSKPPVYGGKVMTPMGPVPTYSTELSPPRPGASSIPTKGPIQGTRGKDPEAMNHLKLRTTSSATTNTQQHQQQQQSVKPIVKPVAQPSSPAHPPIPKVSTPSSPQPQAAELVAEAAPLQPSASTPTPPPVQPSRTPPPLKLSEIPSLQSPPTATGHKRKRSSASSPQPPSSPPTGRAKSSDSTISPASTPASPPITRHRGSASAHTPVLPPPPKEPQSPSPATQAPDGKSAAAPLAQEPAKRRGRPPGSFKVGAARRKHAAKMAKLADVEKAEAVAAAASAVADKAPEEKEEEGEWEEDMEVYEHEPRYCLCNGVSHGLMLGCDNEECDLQWFHLECLGLVKPPPQKVLWFCPFCREGGENGNPLIKARGAGKGAVKGQKKKRRKFK